MEVGVDDISRCVIGGVYLPERERNREEGERPVRDGAGLVSGRQWAGSGWLSPFLFFLTESFSLFLFSVFKTENKNRPKLYIKICKNTF